MKVATDVSGLVVVVVVNVVAMVVLRLWNVSNTKRSTVVQVVLHGELF